MTNRLELDSNLGWGVGRQEIGWILLASGSSLGDFGEARISEEMVEGNRLGVLLVACTEKLTAVD